MLLNFFDVQYCYTYLIDQIPVGLLLYSHIPTALVALLFGFFVFFKSRSRVSLALLVVCVSFAMWVFFDLISWFDLSAAITMYVWSLLFLSGLILFIFSYYFLYTFIKEKDLPIWQKILGIALLLPMILWTFFGSSLLSYDGNSCIAIENNFVTTYYYCAQALLLLFSIIFVVVEYFRAKESVVKKRIILVGIGVIIFLLFFFSSTLLVSLLGESDASSYVYNFEIYGLFGMPVLLIFLGYLIVKFKAFNVRLIGAQALVVTLVVLVGSKLFTDNGANQIITIITLIAICVFGYFLVKSVKKEIETRERIEKLADELEHANERLRLLDQQKSEFVSLASHQLRAPLTSIKGYLSMILEGDYGEVAGELRKIISRVVESSNNLVTIVGDFLDVSRIEQGRMVYDWKDFDLKELVETVGRELRSVAEKKGLEFAVSIQDNADFVIHGDPGKLKQVFTNLVDNSIKYTPKGKVEISLVKNSASTIRFAVKDTGVGIDSKTLPKLFEKFSRAEGASDVNVTGTGLGLFVAKEMVKAHKGKVWAESAGKEKGSAFIVELAAKNQEVKEVKEIKEADKFAGSF